MLQPISLSPTPGLVPTPPTGDVSIERVVASPHRILIGVYAAYVMGAFLIWPALYGQVLLNYLGQGARLLPALLMIGVLLAAIWTDRTNPLRAAWRILRTRGSHAVPVIVAFVAGVAAFTTYKVQIPAVVPFYADIMLADLDDWLHGGAPWRAVHALDSALVGWTVNVSYSALWFIQWFGTVLAVAFWSDTRGRLRYLWALALTTALCGTMLAAALSSVGPIYYQQFTGDSRFGGLLRQLTAHAANDHVRLYADYLLAHYRSGDVALGTGISAMPSMHVALAVLNAFFLSSLHRWLGAAGWLFAALILFGSVFTGWHYAVDGYLSLIVVALIWWATGRYLQGPQTRGHGRP